MHGAPLLALRRTGAESAVFMSAAAARTSKIRLGSSISILPLHHPLQVAEDYAMVDVASGGRLEFGIGMGNTPIDFEHYEIPREQSRERFEEAAEVVIKAWSKERFSHHGKHWSMDDVELYPRPVQRPHPPFWVAGGSPESLGWAGRHGAGIMTVAHPYPPERLIPGMAAWRSGLTEAGHDRPPRNARSTCGSGWTNHLRKPARRLRQRSSATTI